jgi:hypothetical protein
MYAIICVCVWHSQPLPPILHPHTHTLNPRTWRLCGTTSLLKRRVSRAMGLYSESLFTGMGICRALRTSAVVRMPFHPSPFPSSECLAEAWAGGWVVAAASRREQTGL